MQIDERKHPCLKCSGFGIVYTGHPLVINRKWRAICTECDGTGTTHPVKYYIRRAVLSVYRKLRR